MKSATDGPQRSPPLSRDRVLRAAVALADAGGVESLTIRSLAAELRVRPMSVYHHVANKDEILDGIVDVVFSEIGLPPGGGDWRADIRRRANSARRVLRCHPWALGLLESRTTAGPATLRHHDTLIGILRSAGFSVAMTAHAYAVLDSYVYGFVLQEAASPLDGLATGTEVARPMLARFAAGEYPDLVQLATEHYLRPGYDFGAEFELGLGLILDALARSTADKRRRTRLLTAYPPAGVSRGRAGRTRPERRRRRSCYLSPIALAPRAKPCQQHGLAHGVAELVEAGDAADLATAGGVDTSRPPSVGARERVKIRLRLTRLAPVAAL